MTKYKSIVWLIILVTAYIAKGYCSLARNHTKTNAHIDGFLKFSELLEPENTESESGSGSGLVNNERYHEINAKFLIISNNKNDELNNKTIILNITNTPKLKFSQYEDINVDTSESRLKSNQSKSKSIKGNKSSKIKKEERAISKVKEDINKEFELSAAENKTYNDVERTTKLKIVDKDGAPGTHGLFMKPQSNITSMLAKNLVGIEIANVTFFSQHNDTHNIVHYKRHRHSQGNKRTKSTEKELHKGEHKYGTSYKVFSVEETSFAKNNVFNNTIHDIKLKLLNNTNTTTNFTADNKKTQSSENNQVNVDKMFHENNTKKAEKKELTKDDNKFKKNGRKKTKSDVKKELDEWKKKKKAQLQTQDTKANFKNMSANTTQDLVYIKQQNYTDNLNGTVNKIHNTKEVKDLKNITNVQLIAEGNVKLVNTSIDIKSVKNKLESQKRNPQNFTATLLKEELRKVRFKNGASGHVKSGQEFAYISQCGLYTEPQNVSYVQHSWVTKTYSPYFYLYEKPKKYEKCKPSAWMNNTDMRGSVFLSFEVKSLHGSTMENNGKICEKYCCKEPRCAAWVLRLQSDSTSNCPANSYCCWLKTDVPKSEPHEDCVSGLVHREHYKHPPVGMRSSVPLGGLGSGSFEMRADGTFHEWTIENQSPGGSAKLSKTSLEMMLLGVRIKKGKTARSAVLRTHAPHGFENVEGLTYSGSYPVSKFKIDFHKSLKNDVGLNLYAYSAFHPRKPTDSATPAVAFTLEVNNPSNEELDISFMLNLPFGYNDDTIRRGNNFAEIAYTRLVTAADCQIQCASRPKCMAWTTNGPFSCMLKDGMPLHSYELGIISGLKGEWSVTEDLLNCKRPGFYPQSGDISLYPITSGSESTSYVVADDPEIIWDAFKKTGYVSNVTSSVNKTGLNGAVSVSTKLKPKESKVLTIILSWYFPNKDIADERVGNFYSNIFKSSVDVAKHSESDLIKTVEDVVKWQATVMPPDKLKEHGTKKKEKKKEKTHVSSHPIPSCQTKAGDYEILPECLQDILINSLSTMRSGMWMENGRWRQWEAYDCANMDPLHVDFHRIIPYIMFYPEIAKQVMLAWADHQLANGMIQESLSIGCLEETSKEGVAGGRLMTDVNVGFIVQAYMIYSWTNDTSFFTEIYPFAVRAMKWLITDSTKGTGLPYRKPDTFDLFELEKYDHCAYNSILYILALNTMKVMSNLRQDSNTLKEVMSALDRAEQQFDVEMWDERREFYHAWFDDEWGSSEWLMSDVMYGQVWAYTLGLGDLLDREKIKKHLKKEESRNNSPYGLKVISKSDNQQPTEDTSVILGDEINSCKSLENVTKTESIWMSASTDWSTLQLHLGMEPALALEQASKSLNNYRSTLRDEWNFHGLTSSEHYGLDGLPWATSHYTFHLVLWHLPLALSGQQYYAPNGSLTFSPKYEVPYWLPFYIPTCMGNIEAKEEKTGRRVEVLYKFKVSSGVCSLNELSISDSKYARSPVTINEGETLEWSAPEKSKKDIVKAMLDQLKH